MQTSPRARARFRPSDVVDFVIVGSGAAGGILAKELSTAGFSVVVLEQGPRLTEAQFNHDEFGDVLPEPLRQQSGDAAADVSRDGAGSPRRPRAR